MTTADYVLSKLANRTIDDTKFVTETCAITDYVNCIVGLITKYQGKKVWFNSVFTGQSAPPKHLVYWDTTNTNYLYEIAIYTHGNSQSGCCIQNPVTQTICTGTTGTDNCISVTRSPNTGENPDDQVPTVVLDEAINALFGDNWFTKKTCIDSTCIPNWGLVGAGGLLALLLMSKK